MKKILLSLSLFTAVCAHAQVTLVENLPPSAPTSTQVRAPNGLNTHNTLRSHFIIPASEISMPAGTVVEQLGFVLTHGLQNPAGGSIIFYLENTSDATNLKSTDWATAIGTMTQVYSGAYTIPVTAAAINVDFTLGTTFTYTGGGIYVAYDYLGTSFAPGVTADDIATYAANSDLAGSLKNGSTATSTPLTTLNASSAFRPQMRFAYDNPNDNDIEITNMWLDHQHPSLLIDDEQTVTVQVRNASSATLTGVNIALDITGANATSTSQNIATMMPGEALTLTFSGLALTNAGMQDVTVSTVADDDNSDNSMTISQVVSCDTLAYAGNLPAFDNIGFGTGTGILAVKYMSSTEIPIDVNGVTVGLSPDVNNVGKSVAGVLLDTDGNILATSPAHVITAPENGLRMYFPLSTVVTIMPVDSFYVGIVQMSAGHYPVQTQEPALIPAGMVYSFGLTGGAMTNYTDLGMLDIQAVLSGHIELTDGITGDSVCSGYPVTLDATDGYANYDFWINGSSVQNSASDTYNFTPTAGVETMVMSTYNSCMIMSDEDSIYTTAALTYNVTETICEGESFTFGSSVLTTPGTYTETFTGSTMCDSIVNLSLSITMVDETVTQDDEELTANATTGASYVWITCAGVPVGVTTQVFTATANGTYAVVVTQGGCSDTSMCHTVTGLGIANEDNNLLDIYPNPATENITVSAQGNNIVMVNITDISGKVLILQQANANKVVVPVNALVPGTYIIQVQTANGTAVQRFIKS